jgi:hypothetical protein
MIILCLGRFSTTAIDEALSADLDDVRVRQNLDHRLPIEPSHLHFVGVAATHERGGQPIQGVVFHLAPPVTLAAAL